MAEVMDNFLELDEDTQKGKFLTFSLDREEYGIEIKYVTEIIGLQAITEIPDSISPEVLKMIEGMINKKKNFSSEDSSNITQFSASKPSKSKISLEGSEFGKY